MGLFDGQPLTVDEVRQRLLVGPWGDTVRRISKTGRLYTVRHRPWRDLLGAGPDGFTCGDCVHLRRRKMASVYFKCSQHPITYGAGTDIRAKDAACTLFQIEGHP